MLRVELLLRNSNSTLSVQRQSAAAANTLYEQILAAINADRVQTLQLTCDRHSKTKIAVLSSEIIAVNLSEN
jgi:hypothetical protein